MNVHSGTDSEGDLSNASTIIQSQGQRQTQNTNSHGLIEDEKDLRYYPDWSHFRKLKQLQMVI
jgi:hypothetical protein